MTDDFKKEKYWKLVEEFVQELETAKYWLKPDGKPNPEWKLFVKETLDAAWTAAWTAACTAAGDAACTAACTAAWTAAGDAAWTAACTAAGDAARTAARTAARDAAWTAACTAAWTAARTAAGDAARTAAIFARMLVCFGLEVDVKHLTHLNACMEVWRKGYCLKCDVNGVLYVYAKK